MSYSALIGVCPDGTRPSSPPLAAFLTRRSPTASFSSSPLARKLWSEADASLESASEKGPLLHGASTPVESRERYELEERLDFFQYLKSLFLPQNGMGSECLFVFSDGRRID